MLKKSVFYPFWNFAASFGRSFAGHIAYTACARDLPTETKIPKILSGLDKTYSIKKTLSLKTRVVQKTPVICNFEHQSFSFNPLKRLFGVRLFSKKFEKQIMENHLRCLLLNKINSRKPGRGTLGQKVIRAD